MLDPSSTHRKKVVGRHKINYDLSVSRLKTIIHSDPQYWQQIKFSLKLKVNFSHLKPGKRSESKTKKTNL